ncbi:MAG: tetratricopeptide repeat protein [Sandaracinaceae bacterium]|nr:tetratricopeptide repeat protein [Sandaracinaceae bacterium]
MAVGLAALLLVLGSALPAAAQTPASELEARALFEAGEAAVAERRFEDARRLFERSLELHPTAAAAFNAAVAAQEQGDGPGAVAHLDRLLAGALGPLPAGRRASVATMREEAVARLGTLVVHADGPGWRVRAGDQDLAVDGELTLYLAPGTHPLALTTPEGATRERVVELTAGERRVIDVVLEARVQEAARPREAPGSGDPIVDGPAPGDDVALIVGLTVAAVLAVGGGVAIGVAVYADGQLPADFVGRAETLRW